MIIVLIGYMGSGKSVVSKSLADALGYDHIDLDAYIETKVGMSVQEMFQSKGELYFRKTESISLAEVLNKENTVVALGGGTPCYGNNLDLLNSDVNVISVYLKTSIQELASRLSEDASKRPLISHIQSKAQLSEFIAKHLFERAPFYETSKITVSTDNKTIKDITEAILIELF